MTQNPFNQEENISVWLEKDPEFQKVKKDAFQKHIRTHDLQPNILMSLKESYLNLVNFITKNVIASTVLMTLVVAGATVTAAEILLPRYKPSSLLQGWFETTIETPVSKDPKIQSFLNNTQTQKNPNELLVADEQNHVFVNHTCGVVVKYPKKFENSITNNSRTVDGNLQFFAEPPYDDLSNEFNIYVLALDNSFGGTGISMKCSTEKPRVDPFEVKVSKEKLQEITGWFLSVVDISEVTLMENTNIPFGYNYYFKYKDLYYSGAFVEKASGTKEQRNYEYLGGLYATQVQIQFKDQVPNPPQKPVQAPQVAEKQVVTPENVNNTAKVVPASVKADPDFPLLSNLTNFKEEYLDADFFTYKSSCSPVFSSSVLYTPKSDTATTQGLYIADSSSLIDNKITLDTNRDFNSPPSTFEVLDREKVANEFSGFIDSKKPVSIKQSSLIYQTFQDCEMSNYGVSSESFELNLEDKNTRAFITLKEFDGSYRIVIYTKRGKYLIAMFTYFSRSKIDYENSFNFSSEEINSATQTAKNLLRTFQLK